MLERLWRQRRRLVLTFILCGLTGFILADGGILASIANTVQLGLDAPIYSKTYMDVAEASGVMVRTPYEIRRSGWGPTVAEAVAHATRDLDGVYISVDIDCLNFAFAAGTSVVNAGGLYVHEVADALYEIGKTANVVGMDIVEVAPPLDPSNCTQQVAAQLVMNLLAGKAHRT